MMGPFLWSPPTLRQWVWLLLTALCACGPADPATAVEGSIAADAFSLSGSVPNTYGPETLEATSGPWAITRIDEHRVQLSSTVTLTDTLQGSPPAVDQEVCTLNATADWDRRLTLDTTKSSIVCTFEQSPCKLVVLVGELNGGVSDTDAINVQGTVTTRYVGCTGQHGTASYALLGELQR